MQHHEKKFATYLIGDFMCFFRPYLWFFLVWLTIVEGTDFDCVMQASVMRCLVKDSDAGATRLPASLSKVPFESLELRLERDSHYFNVTKYDILQKFKKLIQLDISIKNWIFTSEVLETWELSKANLFFLEKLETLIINGTNFNTHRHSWKLPVTLKKLIITNCNYTNFDLSGCPNLEYVDFRNNPLTRMPIFSNPPPFLKTLILLNSPLYEFTVNDIAGFCKLKHLELGYHSMGSYHRRCECLRLQMWANETGNFTFSLKCNTNAVSSKQCEEEKYTMMEALAIRNDCLNGKQASKSGNKLIIIAIVLLILIALIAAGVFIYFHRKRKRSIAVSIPTTPLTTTKSGITSSSSIESAKTTSSDAASSGKVISTSSS